MTEPTIGPILRQLRDDAGRSQSEQAQLLSAVSGRPVTRNEVSRWENEGRLLTPYWQGHYAATFGVPEGKLRQAVRAAKRRRRQQLDVAEDGGAVLRRQFLGNALTTAASLIIPGTIDASAVSDQRISIGTVAKLAARMPRLRRLDNFLGGADTYPLYAAELNATRGLLSKSTYSDAAGRLLHALVSEQGQQAGWAAFDAGQHAIARQHFEESLAAAKEAQDRSLGGNALAFMAYQAISVGAPAQELAMEACGRAGPDAPARVTALLREREAWAHAISGSARETERALNDAEEALASDDGSPAPDWATWVDAKEVQIMTGRCWSTLRRPLRAVPVLQEVLAEFPATHARDKALYLTWLASAYLDAGEIEQAAGTVGDVLTLSSGVGSVRPMERANVLLRRLKPHRRLAPVSDLLERAAN